MSPILPWETWSQFVSDNPWASDLMDIVRFAHALIDQWGSVVILVGLAFVRRRLRRERTHLEERVETLRQHAKAAAEASENAVGAAKEAADRIIEAVASWQSAGRQVVNGQSSGSIFMPPMTEGQVSNANWERVSDIWSRLKERIELKIERIPRANVRGKYSRMKRRSYQDIISAMRKDRLLRPAAANKLSELDTKFHALKFRPTSITADEVRVFEEGEQMVGRELPSLPDDDSLEAAGPESQLDAPRPPAH